MNNLLFASVMVLKKNVKATSITKHMQLSGNSMASCSCIEKSVVLLLPGVLKQEFIYILFIGNITLTGKHILRDQT